MTKYRKIPVEIDAVQWTGTNAEEIKEFAGDNVSFKRVASPVSSLYINTLEGEMKASVGDFVIRGVKGEFYACKPDVFSMTYEKVPNV